MNFYFPNVDPIYIYKRKGSPDDPFLFLRDVSHVAHGAITMNEIPSFENKVKAFKANGSELSEVNHAELTSSQFRVDYTTGVAFFHSSLNGSEIALEYYGTGYVNIPTTRIKIPNEEGSPLETLQDALDRVDEGIETLGQVGALQFIGEYEPTHTYKKWNFVSYKGRTYVALEDVNNEEPSSSPSWGLVASSVSFVGVYDSSKTYTVGEVVSDENKKNLYVSKIVNNNSPLSDTGAWDLLITLEDTVNDAIDIIDEQIEQLNVLKKDLVDSEIDRDNQEEEREARVTNTLATMELFRQDLQGEEDARVANEDSRVIADAVREVNEANRQNNESTRQEQENARINNEQSRDQRLNMFLNNSQYVIDEARAVVEDITSVKHTIEELAALTQAHVDQTNGYMDELLEWRHLDEYNPEITYKKYNVVSYNGSSYMATQESFNNPPTDEEFWSVVSLKGADGSFVTIEGNEVDENGDISLDGLGLIREDVFNEFVDSSNNKVGNLSSLNTVNKNNIVDAINELKRKIDDVIDAM